MNEMARVNLPARRLLEAEAEAYAREQLSVYSNASNPWSEDSPLTMAAGRAMVRHLMDVLRAFAQLDPRSEMMLVAMARGGDPDADQIVRDMALERRSRGEFIAPWLEAYIWDGQEGFLQRPARKQKNFVVRDLCIAMTVAALKDKFGIDPTGRSHHQRCGCEIVGSALGAARMRRGKDAVVTIWKRYGRYMPTQRGWA
jgi:hypothetical protein